jgi:hypothetical protein
MIPGGEKSFFTRKNDPGQGKIVLHREKSPRPGKERIKGAR